MVINSGEFDRTACVHVPNRYLPGDPLVVVLHGAGGSGALMLDRHGWRAKADAEGFLVAAPDGLPTRPDAELSFLANPRLWNAGQLNRWAPRKGPDDVRFIADLLDAVRDRFAYDERRVYVTGHSNGASMTFRLGAELSDRLAAIAPVAGLIAVRDARPARVLPTLYIIGTHDPFQPLDGGEVKLPWGRRTCAPVSKYLTDWARVMGCRTDPIVVADDSHWRSLEYPPLDGGPPLRAIFVEGHGHEWPGGSSGLSARLMGPSSDHFDATDVIWDFFRGTST
jgi:polyhydroxybutyrate depolymerase